MKDLTEAVEEELKQKSKIVLGSKLTNFVNNIVQEHVESIYICEEENATTENGYIVSKICYCKYILCRPTFVC